MCGRPFDGLDEMHETLITNWNAVVDKSDEIYILGDFLYKGNGQSATNILNNLVAKNIWLKVIMKST